MKVPRHQLGPLKQLRPALSLRLSLRIVEEQYQNPDEKRELIFKEDGQEYAQVLRMLGNGRLEAQCIDGVKRLCHIPRGHNCLDLYRGAKGVHNAFDQAGYQSTWFDIKYFSDGYMNIHFLGGLDKPLCA